MTKYVVAGLATLLAVLVNIATDGRGGLGAWVALIVVAVVVAAISDADVSIGRQPLILVLGLSLVMFAVSADSVSPSRDTLEEPPVSASPTTIPPRAPPRPTLPDGVLHLNPTNPASVRIGTKLTAKFKALLLVPTIFSGEVEILPNEFYTDDSRYDPEDPLKFRIQQGEFRLDAVIRDGYGTADLGVTLGKVDPESDTLTQPCERYRLDSKVVCNEVSSTTDAGRWISEAFKNPAYKLMQTEVLTFIHSSGTFAIVGLRRNIPEPEATLDIDSAKWYLSSLVKVLLKG